MWACKAWVGWVGDCSGCAGAATSTAADYLGTYLPFAIAIRRCSFIGVTVIWCIPIHAMTDCVLCTEALGGLAALVAPRLVAAGQRDRCTAPWRAATWPGAAACCQAGRSFGCLPCPACGVCDPPRPRAPVLGGALCRSSCNVNIHLPLHVRVPDLNAMGVCACVDLPVVTTRCCLLRPC